MKIRNYHKIDTTQFLTTVQILGKMARQGNGKEWVPILEELEAVSTYEEGTAFLEEIEEPKTSVLNPAERIIYAPADISFTLNPGKTALIPLGFIIPDDEELLIPGRHLIACSNILLKSKNGLLGSAVKLTNLSSMPALIRYEKGEVFLKALSRKMLNSLFLAIDQEYAHELEVKEPKKGNSEPRITGYKTTREARRKVAEA